MFVHIATSRGIGKRCKEWAIWNLPEGWEFSGEKEADVFISVLYDKILDEDFIRERRCYNFHPGILPWYRGSGAYSWAIINGEFETGVTLHKIDKSIDHGPVIDIARFPISQDDTAEILFRKAEKTILKLFHKWFIKLLKSDHGLVPQEAGRIYYRKDLEAAKNITKYVRAFTFEGKERCYYMKNGEKIYI